MRSVELLTLAALLPAALASWNGKICSGAGGCVGTSWAVPDPFRCPDATLLNTQQTASNSIDASNGAYSVITAAEFPTTCLEGRKPSDKDVLIKRTTEFGQTMFLWLTETCTDPSPAHPGDCYTYNPNPSSTTICQVVDTKGQNCVMNPLAGECERWGTAAGRTQCEGWTPDQVEEPTSM
ncbi:hypothetical protein P153DRAFT_299371 [Dothidotthia symphoricarpi CBS 119687]|uniref:Uncharacterized protein n=1 Tax=Dothidotthia symphoricarpi CBS 119687 TaxID=1392245 RepID=A0A6A6A3R8_9PLEO|nr:uncharacterized protein P153DRAFT_299371 [Dothidotthia symphoricarpi CBS 119687]KAF2125764.1 hypothetical protein P153DRAFT_299371 [Dothidotthia symphoricarpi CBS 119687]